MRNRQSGGYLAFFILFLIINVAPTIYRAITQNSENLAEAFSDVGSLTNYLGAGALIAVILYFFWAQLGSNENSVTKDEAGTEASSKEKWE